MVLLALLSARAESPPVTTVTISAESKAISPDLFGIFFEDLNYAADGGLYAELVQNRSFEYAATEQPTWGPLTGWEFIQRGGGAGDLWVDSSRPIHPNNPHCALLRIRSVGEGVGLSNAGFDGIAVKAGEKYDFSVFARMLNVGGRDNKPAGKLPLSVRLETKDGAVLGEASVEASDPAEWKQLTANITASETVPDARLVVLAKTPGLIALDEISLFPQATFKGRKNGLRADLAQTIADLHPKFMRFPGGCLAHGDGLGNIYRWKDTIGPVEQRKGQANIWRYHQSVGLGYFEYFQFCEDTGAKPLPVVAAGVSCQNSTRTRETGQQCLPLADMPAYIQDALDLIEWANGPTNSIWGAKRAAAGHPAPFGLKYLGVGNEDKITPGFKERFQMIYNAVQKKHPEIIVIGTVGPAPDGRDFETGWKFATELRVPMVDEHYYKSPQWFWDNLQRYEKYDRTKPKVYVGEYAAHDGGRRSTLRSALAEAAYLTTLERNGDVVQFASYAPLLARRGHTQWTPDLIYFNGAEVFPTISYYVQQLFGINSGDTCLSTVVSDPREFATSSVRDGATGDLIVKLVNGANTPKPLRIELNGVTTLPGSATKTVLTGENADVVNRDGDPSATKLEVSSIEVGQAFDYEAPPNSFTVIRMKSK
ncbi:MAG: alpha-N-arabinofuranosidase [Verrucomicrobia bacterium]|nr:MAG: alpha-N-arabinofuranosidase [Verrucomicrobiota bacterium]